MAVRRLLALLLMLAAGCAPPATPAPAWTATPTPPVAALATVPASPLPPAATASAPPPAATPSPTPAPPVEPAGCLSADQAAAMDAPARLAYAQSLLPAGLALAPRGMTRAWNASTGQTEPTGSAAFAFSFNEIQNEYLLQDVLDALQVAGFAAWLRRDESGLNILAVPVQASSLDSVWGEYVRAYWQAPDGVPEGEKSILPARRLPACRWAVAAGLAPDLPDGTMEQADWAQPDVASAAQPYLAANSASARDVACRIDWLPGGDVESPALMCGPLTWSILHDARAFPPGWGAWQEGPRVFWLPKPTVNGRPWSLFPADSYVLRRFSDPLGAYDFRMFPLRPGDVLYTYSRSNGFDHVLAVSEVDAQGRAYAVTNLVQQVPERSYSIERVLLYDPNDTQAGIFHGRWANDLLNGRTGDAGFDVFRWAWSEKDAAGQAVETRVRPGDTLALVAARWRTPPGLIAQANGLEPSAGLRLGQVLTIPPNPPAP